jgi:hypothetical protein
MHKVSTGPNLRVHASHPIEKVPDSPIADVAGTEIVLADVRSDAEQELIPTSPPGVLPRSYSTGGGDRRPRTYPMHQTLGGWQAFDTFLIHDA